MDRVFKEFYEKNLIITKKEIKDSINRDTLIIQAIKIIEELNRVINSLIKRVREWYSYYLPELERAVQDNNRFIKIILSKERKELLRELGLEENRSMGQDFKKSDLTPLFDLAKEIEGLCELKHGSEIYLEELLKELCPNMCVITGALLGARLIEHTGSIKRLAILSASQIQLLGAEKALFRHLRKGSLCPKYGILHEHPLISKAKKSEHGKIARALADKISIAIKVDFFKGKYIGDRLKEELEKRFGK